RAYCLVGGFAARTNAQAALILSVFACPSAIARVAPRSPTPTGGAFMVNVAAVICWVWLTWSYELACSGEQPPGTRVHAPVARVAVHTSEPWIGASVLGWPWSGPVITPARAHCALIDWLATLESTWNALWRRDATCHW